MTGNGSLPGRTLAAELDRLKEDYPAYTARFRRDAPRTGRWTCYLTGYTQMFGDYAFHEGRGDTRIMALAEARKRPDSEREKEEARQAAMRAAEDIRRFGYAF